MMKGGHRAAIVGADDRDRTGDLNLGKVALYQLSYVRAPVMVTRGRRFLPPTVSAMQRRVRTDGAPLPQTIPQSDYLQASHLRRRRFGAPVPRWVRETLDIVSDLRLEARHDNIVLVAAGVAFYSVLAILPALFIAVSLYGIFTDPAEAERQIESLLEILPDAAGGILHTQMRTVASTPQAHLSVGFVVSFAALFWTVSNAIRAIVGAVKIAYDQETERSSLEKRSAALGLSIAAIIGGLVLLAVVAAVPIWLQQLDPTDAVVTFGNLRWLFIVSGFGFVVGLLYRYAPPSRPDGWRRVLPGVVFATAMWLASSIGFSVYVSSFGSYNETYGTLGGAVVLLLWFWFTSLAVIAGAELNEILTLRSAALTDT